ncbi:unnamed protein product [Rodentolepis nana]|uniref:Neuropeptide n=1 Tax=Rodentolepis nana TaxID=102285 RepID=A0A0R3TWC0_RODNA|nr:unnamed protein product [Rodentolepis nana]
MTQTRLSEYKMGIFILMIVLMTFVSANSESKDENSSIDDFELPKERKPLFRTARELRRYLEQLDEWLAITGRPRFG